MRFLVGGDEYDAVIDLIAGELAAGNVGSPDQSLHDPS